MISVVIPTVDRPRVLAVTLSHLARQTLPLSAFEVIVVNDGSVERSELTKAEQAPINLPPLPLITERLPRVGAAAARNAGARRASADVLVFLDDDVALAPYALEAMVEAVPRAGGAIVLGALVDVPAPHGDVVTDWRWPGLSDGLARRPGFEGGGVDEVPFIACLTGLLGVTSADFWRLGGFQDPTGGWPSWDDVDFGYRAHRAGLRTLRARRAQAIHRDAAQGTYEAARDRWWRAGHSAVRLFERHPELAALLPMFQDKTPIDWQRDDVSLVARKLARRLLSGTPALAALEGVRSLLVALRMPKRWILRYEARLMGMWIAGGHRAGRAGRGAVRFEEGKAGR